MKIGNTILSILELHKESMEVLGFWDEVTKTTVKNLILDIYNTETVKNFFIQDIVMKEDKVLVKWQKRFEPLTKEELKEKWNR